jgi:predicted extracellular nuclease
MSYSSNARVYRQLFALLTAAFFLLQPTFLMAQRQNVKPAQKVKFEPKPQKAIAQKPVRMTVGLPNVSLTTLGVPYTQNFDTLAQAGTNVAWTDDTTIAGWYSTRTTYNAGTGSSNAGALYSFGVAGTNPVTDRALGSVCSNTTGAIVNALKLTNNTGSSITSLSISFNGEQWRDGGAAVPNAQTLSFQYQVATAGTITDADTPNTGWTGFSSLDFTSPTFVNTGAGAALDGNAAANRTAKSATLTFGTPIAAGQEIWLRWSDPNDTGNDHGLAIDDLSVTPNGGAVTPTLNINDVTLAEGNAGTTSFTFNVTLSTPAGPSGVTFDIATADGTAQDGNPGGEDNDYVAKSLTGQSIASGSTGPYQFTVDVNGDGTNEPNETFFVNVTNISAGATPGDTQGQGTINNDDAPLTPIHTIQGSGTASPLDGMNVSTRGIVTLLKTNGFYLQDRDVNADADPNTSEGIFVFTSSAPTVAVGDDATVTGTVDEFNNLTEINSVTLVVTNSSGNPLPTVTVYDLPEPVDGDFERVENMLVSFPETLTVSGNFNLGHFGELVLSSDGRMFQQNNFDRPNSAGALAIANLNERRYVVLDDNSSVSNPDPTPYFNASNTRRVGDTVANLTGVLTFDFSEYRLQPTVVPVFNSANPRTAAPDPVGGNLKVASFNVLNYFNGNGAGGGFPTTRGASSAAEFTRQRNKIIAAMVAINADVFGIIEIENDGNGATSAIQDLINGLNAATSPGTYAFTEGTTPGTDEIKNSIIYKVANVTPDGAAVNDTDSVWTGQARNPLAQTFTHNGNGQKFTFIVNHYTSKGCSASDTGLDADQGDGQGCDNFTRTQQSQRLLAFIQERKVAANDSDVLVMGDLNAYGEEDPIFTLEQDAGDALVDGPGGLISQIKKFVPAANRYSFQFDSTSGYLDHAFTTKELDPYVTGTTTWHINADEPTVLDYNLENKSAAQQAINVGTAYRSSDHDPVIVGVNLSAVAPQAAGSLIISELRFRGSGGSQDEFVELYNSTAANITVATTDGSAGWTVVASTGGELCRVDNGTIIPVHGHFLCTNVGGYSLNDYGGTGNGGGDVGWIGADIPDGGGVALFRSNNPVNYTVTERLDAAGYTSAPALYREGAGFPTGGNEFGNDIEYSFFRSMTRATSGLPKDTGDNAADFMSVTTDGISTSLGQNLGAPGPENLASPINRSSFFSMLSLDGSVSASAPPNRVRDFTSDSLNNSTFGTLDIRRRVVNNTGAAVTKLRFRLVEFTTFPQPMGVADLRARTSSLVVVSGINDSSTCFASTGSASTPCTVNVQGTTLEQPPSQTFGGGYNSTLSAGTITLGTPLANGASINLHFLLGIQQTGTFKFFINIEALP